jgi:hypothetical protein
MNQEMNLINVLLLREMTLGDPTPSIFLLAAVARGQLPEQEGTARYVQSW